MIEAWGVRPLSEVLELQRGHDLPAGVRVSGSVPVIGSFGVTGFHNVPRYSGPGVAIGRSGASIGKATYVGSSFWPLNTCLFVRDFRGNDPRWVYLLLKTTDFSGFNSGSAQPSLNRNFLKSIPIHVPPIDEQRAIAEVLGTLDDKIAANDRVLAILDDLNDLIVSEGAQGPSSRSVQLRELLRLNYGKALPAKLRIDGDVVVLGSGGPTGTHAVALVDHPGIVVGRKGTVGAVYWAEGPHYPIDTTYFVEPISNISSEVLFYLLRSAPLAELNSDSAVPGLNREEAYVQRVRVPNGVALLNRIGERLRENFALMQGIRLENQKLAAMRDKLLPLLMSGRLRVKDAERAVEEVV